MWMLFLSLKKSPQGVLKTLHSQEWDVHTCEHSITSSAIAFLRIPLLCLTTTIKLKRSNIKFAFLLLTEYTVCQKGLDSSHIMFYAFCIVNDVSSPSSHLGLLFLFSSWSPQFSEKQIMFLYQTCFFVGSTHSNKKISGLDILIIMDTKDEYSLNWNDGKMIVK